MTVYKGKGISPGIAVGPVFLLKKADVPIEKAFAKNTGHEWARFLTAKQETDSQLSTLFQKAKGEIGEGEAMIVDVQRMMLEDGDFIEFVENLIKNEKYTAHYAVIQAGKHFSDFFSALEDPYMSARATDIGDVSHRLAQRLLGRDMGICLKEPSVVLAEDLAPSETLQMDKSKVLAFVIQRGSGNSHTAILARIMNIPCVVQCDVALDEAIVGKEMAVDGEMGLCYLEPCKATTTQLQQKQEKLLLRKGLLANMRGLATITKSGKRIGLFSNIGSSDDLVHVLENDAEGIGLFRSEFLYLGRSSFPSEEEQFDAYRKVVEGMEGKHVIIRTLDIGADKQLEHFKLDAEENPALGLRGIRICIQRPDIFKTQLRAIYRASAFGDIGVMFPMISSLWEVKHCKEFISKVLAELKSEGIIPGNVKIGIMIETPAAAMIACEFAREVDFFSVGTNDLTQYVLAVDRQNSRLESFFDPHHPGVMKMLEMVARAACSAGISVGICGELAADLSITEALVNMGFDKLSVSPGHILGLREAIRNID